MSKPFLTIGVSSDFQGGEVPASPGTAKLRVNAGVLEVSANAGAWSAVTTAATAATATGGASTLTFSPTLTTSGATPLEILTYTHPSSLTAARVVQAVVTGSLYSPDGATTAGLYTFYFSVNAAAAVNCATRFMSTTNYQTVWSGTRLLTLPAGAVVIKVFCVRSSGTGTAGFNADNFINMTFVG